MRSAIYTRISEDDAEGDFRGKGVARQQKDAEAEAARRGWDVLGVYADNDVSATRSKIRPQYERMVRDIRAGLIDAVIVWDIDRLTRSPREIEDFIELAEATGMLLVNLTGAGDVGTDDGRMMLRMKGVFARREVEQMRKRLRRKFLENAESGKPHGRAPYGMLRKSTFDGRGKLVDFWDIADPDTAPILREIATRVLRGDSLRGVAMDLTARGIPGPGGAAWNSTIIRQALIRPSYAGVRVYQGKPIGETRAKSLGLEMVFDTETHERLVALLTDPTRRQNHRGRQPLYLLSGIAVCGRCGGSMRSQIGHQVTTSTGTKRQPPSYGCSVCFKVRRQREPVDAVVDAVVLRKLDDPTIVSRLFAKGDPEVAGEASKRIAVIDAKLAITADQFADDSITAEQMKRITARLRDERAGAVARLRAAAPNDRIGRFSGRDIAAVWAAADVPARREVIEALFVVTIDPQGPGKPFDPDLIRIDWKVA